MMAKNCEPNPFANLYEKLVCEMTATEFEKYCFEILKAYAENEKLQDFKIAHDERIKTSDGTYQIDISATFTVLNCTFKVLVECKKYKKSVERKVVAELRAKLNSIGAQKGIVISTAGFQKGAVEYARVHGIALIQVFNKSLRFVTMSANRKIGEEKKLYMNLYPDYYAATFSENDIPDIIVYPTEKMLEEIRCSLRKRIKSNCIIKDIDRKKERPENTTGYQ